LRGVAFGDPRERRAEPLGGRVSDEPRDRGASEEEEDFEPLDRFFAPIEDVEWTDEPGEDRPAAPAADQPPEDEDDLLLPTPDIPSDPLADLELGDEPEPAAGPGLGQEVFPVEADPGTRVEPEGQHELTLEDLKTPPAAYADLPGPRDEEVGDVAVVESDGGLGPDAVLEPDRQQAAVAAV